MIVRRPAEDPGAGIPERVAIDRRYSLAARIVLAALLALGLARAAVLAWLCDDAFISIRYAENLASGLGLVYNAGEYVEGYSNLSWTLLLAASARVGASPVATAQYLGIACYAALALVLALWSRRRAADTGRPFLPLAAGLALVSDDFQVWATGGLETMLFVYLAIQALLLTRLPSPSRSRSLLAGAILGLLVLTRPDGLLFAAAGCASFWIPLDRHPPRERLAHALAVAAPVAVVLAILVPVKLAYYGEILPTAFYSKSVLRPYLSQGAIYVWLYLAKNWFLPLALLGLVIARRRREPGGGSNFGAGDDLFFIGAAALFIAYLVEVGGDFMFARRLIPAVPLLFLVIENHLTRIQRPRLRSALALAVLAAAALPASLYGDTPGAVAGVYDERRSYPPEKLALRQLQGETLAAALAGTDVRVAFEGGMCSFGYYSGLPYLAEMTGLTQYSLAKRPLAERGVVGHEKAPDAAWFEENRIHLLVKQDLPPLPPLAEPGGGDEIRFGDVARAQILLYSDEVMDPLRDRPGVSFVPIEALIARSAEQMKSSPLADAERLYEQLQHYYFRAAGERGRPAAARLRGIIERKRRLEAGLRRG